MSYWGHPTNPSSNPWSTPQLPPINFNPFATGMPVPTPIPVSVPCFGYPYLNPNFFGENQVWQPNQGQTQLPGGQQPLAQPLNIPTASSTRTEFFSGNPILVPDRPNPWTTRMKKNKARRTKTMLDPIASVRQSNRVLKIFDSTDGCYVLLSKISSQALLALNETGAGYVKDGKFNFPSYMRSVVEATLAQTDSPVPSSSIIPIPIRWLNRSYDRYYIELEYLPTNAVTAITSLSNCFVNMKKGKVHFPFWLHSQVQRILNNLCPPLQIDVPEPEPEVSRRGNILKPKPTTKINTAFPPLMDFTNISAQPHAQAKAKSGSTEKSSENTSASAKPLLTLPCWKTHRTIYFFESDLSEEGVQFIRNSKLPLYPRELDDGRKFCVFRPASFTQIAKALLYSPCPCKLEQQPGPGEIPKPFSVKKRMLNPTPVLIDLTGSSPPKTKANRAVLIPTSTVTSVEATYLKEFEEIPGYRFLKHLIAPSLLDRIYGGEFLKSFSVKLSADEIGHFYQSTPTKDKRSIIIRLIAINKVVGCGSSVVKADKGFRIQEVKCPSRSAKFSTRKATEFSVDITKFFSRTESTSIKVKAKYDNARDSDVSDYEIYYSVTVVRKYNVEEMLYDLTCKSQIPLAVTLKRVTDSLKEAEEAGILASDPALLISLICPLGKNQMTTPCKGIYCEHYTCFDAKNFLQIYENSPGWKCPVCDAPLAYEDLRIDSYFDIIIRYVGENAKNFNIKVDSAGEFHVVPIDQDNPTLQHNETIALIEEEDDIVDVSSSEDEDVTPRKRKKSDVVAAAVVVKKEQPQA